jgi:hypothetical protein
VKEEKEEGTWKEKERGEEGGKMIDADWKRNKDNEKERRKPKRSKEREN